MSPNLPHILAVEFMHRRLPTEPHARRVFEFALRARMHALSGFTSPLFLCDSPDTASDLHAMRVRGDQPILCLVGGANYEGRAQAGLYDWAGYWQRMTMSDRWARIREALWWGQNFLTFAARLEPDLALPPSTDWYLLLSAHDAVYTRDLLLKLVDFSRQHAQNGLPAAVSPYTYYQHSPLPSAAIPMPIVDLVNAAFHRDPGFRLQLERGDAQGFWGKMGLIPFDLCGDLLKTVDTGIWEDDLELDRAINALGCASQALWIDDPAAYRHILPAFNAADVRRIIERHLHYSLRTGGSHLTAPITDMARYLRVIDPHYGAASAWADQIIEQEYAKMMRRVDQHGASWVDWGAYRYVARPYDPHVEVWKEVKDGGS